MAKVFIEETTLTAIGDAIRSKTGKTDLIDPALMSEEISSITTGGGGEEPPEEALTITGQSDYRFAYSYWDWFIARYGHKIVTKDLDTTYYMFYNSSKLEEIPFVINIKDATKLSNAFGNMEALKVCPKIRGTFKKITSGNAPELAGVINNCRNLRDVEDLFEPEMLGFFKEYKTTVSYYNVKPITFEGCWSLRQAPTWLNKLSINEESTYYPNSSGCLYYNLFYNCYTLNEAINLPVWRCAGAQTKAMFTNTFTYCNRLKAVTFETNPDGTPIETKWKGQTIDLTSEFGYTPSTLRIINHNSGITADKLVNDDATYQALKNDPDWFTTSFAYCRYNHDSAVETINSLPDTSAYLATAGGTNTIKFIGALGSATDGGAINTLTAEEIAVAAAKGWTVTLT